MSISSACEYVRRTQDREIAVVVIGSRPKCVSISYMRKIRHYLRRGAVLAGIYDCRVPREWIERDLINAGAKA